MTYAIAIVFALLISVPVVLWLESDHPNPSAAPPQRKKTRP